MRTAVCVALMMSLMMGVAMSATFNDVFNTPPGEINRAPFMWWIPASAPDGDASWELVDGALQYRAVNTEMDGALVSHFDAGVEVVDSTNWSLEAGFRHISGTAPIDQYEAVLYVCWQSDTPGHIGLLFACYDAAKKQISFQNGSESIEPFAADLTGDFHPVRVTVEDRQVRLYVDGELKAGPQPLGSLKWEAPARFFIGPITKTQKHTLCCQWDYVAFTDEGAIAPGDAGWDPSKDTEPVSVEEDHQGPAPVDPESCFRQEPYPNIKPLGRWPGTEAYHAALPPVVHKWRQFTADMPPQIQVAEYRYPDTEGPTSQNVYRDVIPLETEDGRCVSVFHMTRGTGDTIYGFSDYKLWYAVSTDGGTTWDAERPVIQRGEEYSGTHPVKYVWIGTNSFVFATLPAFLYPMSNGQMLLPCYYLPLDDAGKPYNPLNTSTYSQVFCLIGTWNEARDDVIWDVTEPITLGTENSTSGLSECAVIELADKPGHMFMVIRAGNEDDKTRTVPSWKWKTLSTDYGRTWSELVPFTFSDGTKFFSPTSQSNFIRSSRTGKVYWIGNISRVRPRSGWPRYPLVIAELDEETLGLRKETVTIIDDRSAQDGSNMQLSNFDFAEDPETGHIIVRLNRFNGGPGATGLQEYRIEVK